LIVPAGGGEFTAAWTHNESALQITTDEAVMLERGRQAMGRWPRQAGSGDEFAQ
jgi:hypothetical protein